MKIAVCDDRPNISKNRELLEKYQQTVRDWMSQAEYFLSGAELLDQAEERGGYDLYLLDILMPGENGISVGKRLRQMGKQGELIFLTSSNDYAADSYEVRAFFYLLKPVEEEKLFRVLDQAVEKLTQQQKKTHAAGDPGGNPMYSAGPDSLCGAGRTGDALSLHR